VKQFLQRDAMLAPYMMASCVCLSVRLSDTSWYYIKAAKHSLLDYAKNAM